MTTQEAVIALVREAAFGKRIKSLTGLKRIRRAADILKLDEAQLSYVFGLVIITCL